ncbi:hypothetical protein GUITHDRAFT_144172 [Guillardia theta CCMP2712]|uniref:Fungal lipase-type domain-containing protein n=1 Tax=Guillardia theta (strain CCMP2712) TaxID=905079 RepID=L1IR49_GUITC|nr:hypothetical protein GUITHDRAFT_144172 [Guillardia theta CCMP2712]EKX38577.1 hypothetical protein GUITHDRAFT_144172 [Guillardia theta CCMP2712]|eukprot:XP_005825557.1 hypothetical protein GUITHDRAFT_144172 [Guillardia theta CCMP2712]
MFLDGSSVGSFNTRDKNSVLKATLKSELYMDSAKVFTIFPSVYNNLQELRNDMAKIEDNYEKLKKRLERLENDMALSPLRELEAGCLTVMSIILDKNPADPTALNNLRQLQFKANKYMNESLFKEYRSLLASYFKSGECSNIADKSTLLVRLQRYTLGMLRSFQVELIYFAFLLDKRALKEEDIKDSTPRPLQIMGHFAESIGRAYWLMGPDIPDDLAEESKKLAINFQTEGNFQDLVACSLMVEDFQKLSDENLDINTLYRSESFLLRILALDPCNSSLRNDITLCCDDQISGILSMRRLLHDSNHAEDETSRSNALKELVRCTSVNLDMMLKYLPSTFLLYSIACGLKHISDRVLLLRSCKVLSVLSRLAHGMERSTMAVRLESVETLFDLYAQHTKKRMIADLLRDAIINILPSAEIKEVFKPIFENLQCYIEDFQLIANEKSMRRNISELKKNLNSLKHETDSCAAKLNLCCFNSYCCLIPVQSLQNGLLASLVNHRVKFEVLTSHSAVGATTKQSSALIPSIVFIKDNVGTCHVIFTVGADDFLVFFQIIEKKEDFQSLTADKVISFLKSSFGDLKSQRIGQLMEKTRLEEDVNVQVSTLIYQGMKQIYEDFVAKLLSVSVSHDIKRFVFSGHAIGGCFAMVARLMMLGKNECKHFFQAFEVVQLGSPLTVFCRDMSTSRVLPQLSRATRCYVNESDLVARLLGPKKSKWKDFWEEKRSDNTATWTTTAIVGGIAAGAGMVALSVATGGIATIMSLTAAGVLVGRCAECEDFATVIYGQAVLRLTGLHALHDEKGKDFNCVGSFRFLNGNNSKARVSFEEKFGADAEARLDIPTERFDKSIAANQIQRYLQSILLWKPETGSLAFITEESQASSVVPEDVDIQLSHLQDSLIQKAVIVKINRPVKTEDQIRMKIHQIIIPTLMNRKTMLQIMTL